MVAAVQKAVDKVQKLKVPSFPTAEATSTVAENCIVRGDGLTVATCGQLAQFTIEARDAQGRRSTCSSDQFFVYLRGPSKVRASVVNHSDGTYKVEWRTYTSGQYYIAVSLFGVNLPGSPFALYVFHSKAHAPNCQVSGTALTKACVREKQTFEICFCDQLGQPAPAMEVDVCAELQHSYGRPSNPSHIVCAEPSSSARRRDSGSPPAMLRGMQWVKAEHLSPLLSDRASRRSPPSQRSSARMSNPTINGNLKEKALLLPVQKVERIEGTASERAVRKLSESHRKASGSQKNPKGLINSNLGAWSPLGNGDLLAPVSERSRLDVSRRHNHSDMWSRRESVDKLTNVNGVVTSRGDWTIREKSAYMHELDTDPTGFAFGGTKPAPRGRGKEGNIHHVSYSVGLAGQYLLHVRLRKEGLPVPGSPFSLEVTPGTPVAHASFLTTEVRPMAGKRAGALLRTCDLMGNACPVGGANVTCTCPASDSMEITVKDLNDGTYQLGWMALPGVHQLQIKLEGEHIFGSPMDYEPREVKSLEAKGSVRSDGRSGGGKKKAPTPTSSKFARRPPCESQSDADNGPRAQTRSAEVALNILNSSDGVWVSVTVHAKAAEPATAPVAEPSGWLTRAINMVESAIDLDINGDGTVGGVAPTAPSELVASPPAAAPSRNLRAEQRTATPKTGKAKESDATKHGPTKLDPASASASEAGTQDEKMNARIKISSKQDVPASQQTGARGRAARPEQRSTKQSSDKKQEAAQPKVAARPEQRSAKQSSDRKQEAGQQKAAARPEQRSAKQSSDKKQEAAQPKVAAPKTQVAAQPKIAAPKTQVAAHAEQRRGTARKVKDAVSDQDKAAARVQAGVRGRNTREEQRRARILARTEKGKAKKDDEAQAAVKMQAALRGRAVRNLLFGTSKPEVVKKGYSMKMARIEKERLAKMAMAVPVTRSRGQQLSSMLSASTKLPPTQNEAAAKVQSVTRGRNAREEQRKARIKARTESERKKRGAELSRDEAAARVQATMRGRQVRKSNIGESNAGSKRPVKARYFTKTQQLRAILRLQAAARGRAVRNLLFGGSMAHPRAAHQEDKTDLLRMAIAVPATRSKARRLTAELDEGREPGSVPRPPNDAPTPVPSTSSGGDGVCVVS